MTTLTEFLLARIAEEEAALTEPDPTPHGRHLNDAYGTFDASCPTCRQLVSGSRDRGLAACKAHREVIAIATDQIRLGREARGWANWEDMAKQLLQAVASIYADHPEYREEWRP